MVIDIGCATYLVTPQARQPSAQDTFALMILALDKGYNEVYDLID
jgi:hypothetical protein